MGSLLLVNYSSGIPEGFAHIQGYSLWVFIKLAYLSSLETANSFWNQNNSFVFVVVLRLLSQDFVGASKRQPAEAGLGAIVLTQPTSMLPAWPVKLFCQQPELPSNCQIPLQLLPCPTWFRACLQLARFCFHSTLWCGQYFQNQMLATKGRAAEKQGFDDQLPNILVSKTHPPIDSFWGIANTQRASSIFYFCNKSPNLWPNSMCQSKDLLPYINASHITV